MTKSLHIAYILSHDHVKRCCAVERSCYGKEFSSISRLSFICCNAFFVQPTLTGNRVNFLLIIVFESNEYLVSRVAIFMFHRYPCN